jgi:hypothetical protein
MKKVYIPFMFLTFLVIFYVGMFVINDTRANEEFINTEKKVDIIHDYTELNFVNNVLTIDFSSLDKSLEFVNNYIGLDDTLDVKYNAIITNAIKANNGVKMYDSGKNKVFQFKLPKEEAMKLIGKYKDYLMRTKYVQYYEKNTLGEYSVLMECQHGKNINGNIFYLAYKNNYLSYKQFHHLKS